MNEEPEYIDILDESGKTVLRRALKDETHKDGSLHAVVIGVVIDPAGNRWVVRQASDRQDAGQFVNPVGGHVQSGESLEDAMRREAREEIGWTDVTLSKIGAAVFSRTVIGRKENHFFNVYRIWSDEPIQLNEESVEIKTFTKAEHDKLLAEQPHLFGDAHHFVETTFADYFA